jgi:hypothetical protein
LYLTALLLPATVHPQDRAETSPDLNSAMPRCGPQLDGEVFCKFGTIYECELVSPMSLERRTGWRWKADLLRTCVEPSSAAIQDRTGTALPPDFTYSPQQSDLNTTPAGRNSATPSRPYSAPRPGGGTR